jgi:hypothetical protein
MGTAGLLAVTVEGGVREDAIKRGKISLGTVNPTLYRSTLMYAVFTPSGPVECKRKGSGNDPAAGIPSILSAES